MTSERLNGMVDYLQGQTKLSRSCLFGYGIVEGLSYECDERKGELTIKPGVAVTPDGDLIAIKEAMTFSEKSGGSFPESKKGLVVAKPSVNVSQKLPERLSDSLLAALEIYEERQQIVCNQRSCNVNHSGVVRKVRLRTVEKGQVGKSSRKFVPIDISLELERLTDIHTALNYDVLMKKIHDVFEANQKTIVDGMLKVQQRLGILTKGNPSTGKNQSFDSSKSEFTLESVIPDWKKGASEFVGAVTKISMLNKRGKGSLVIPPYYLLFLEDMRKALLEFIDFYNEFAKKYKRNLLPCVPYNSNMVVLGCLATSDAEIDSYRDYFRDKKPDSHYVADCDMLGKLFTRILKMSAAFVAGRYGKVNTVRIIPEVSSPRLGDKVVPFYYEADDEFRDYWGVNRLASTKVLGCEDFKESNGARNPYNYTMDGLIGYSLQGGYYQRCDDVKSIVERIIDKYNLPIEVEVLEISNIKLSESETKGYYHKLCRYVKDIRVENAINQFDIETNENYKKENFSHIKPEDDNYEEEKNKYEKDRKDTQKTKDALCRVFQEKSFVLSFLKGALEKKPLQKTKQLVDLSSNLKVLTPHRMKMFYKYAFPDAYDIKNRFSPRRESVSTYKRFFWTIRPVAAVSQIRDYVLKTYRPAYKNAEFGMIEKYGKVVLVSYKRKVVMDFFLR